MTFSISEKYKIKFGYVFFLEIKNNFAIKLTILCGCRQIFYNVLFGGPNNAYDDILNRLNRNNRCGIVVDDL